MEVLLLVSLLLTSKCTYIAFVVLECVRSCARRAMSLLSSSDDDDDCETCCKDCNGDYTCMVGGKKTPYKFPECDHCICEECVDKNPVGVSCRMCKNGKCFTKSKMVLHKDLIDKLYRRGPKHKR